jgi:hypothetical protein
MQYPCQKILKQYGISRVYIDPILEAFTLGLLTAIHTAYSTEFRIKIVGV